MPRFRRRAVVKYRSDRGTWNVVVDKGTDHERVILCGRGDYGHERAVAFEAELNLEQLRPTHVTPGMTFREFSGWWLENVIHPNQKPSYYASCEQALRLHLNPTFGDRPMTSIQRTDIIEFAAAKQRVGLKRKTTARLLAAISTVFSYAIEAQSETLVKANPATHKGRILGRKGWKVTPVDPHQVYDAAQVQHLLTFAETWCVETTDFLAIITPFLTGLRQGEVFGLQWTDLNMVDQTIVLRRAVKYTRTGLQVESPKNGEPLRAIDAPRELLDRFQALEGSVRNAEAVLAGAKPSPWIFSSFGDTARPINGNSFYTGTWTQILKAAGLHHIRYHDARHTFATVALTSGIDIGWVSKQLGHADIGFTGRIYAHWKAGRNPQLIEAIASLVGRHEYPSSTFPGTIAQLHRSSE